RVRQSKCFNANSPRLPHGKAECKIRKPGNHDAIPHAARWTLPARKFLPENSKKVQDCGNPRKSKACRSKRQLAHGEMQVPSRFPRLSYCPTSDSDYSAPVTLRPCRTHLQCRP